eukprot:g11968.t1
MFAPASSPHGPAHPHLYRLGHGSFEQVPSRGGAAVMLVLWQKAAQRVRTQQNILELCARSLAEFNSINIASAFYKLARCRDARAAIAADPRAFESLVQAAEACDTWTPRSLASMAWWITRLRTGLASLFSGFSSVA